jgi:microcystin-dependent protein
MTVFCPLSTQPVFFQARPQVGAQVSFYDAGTLTPRVAYSDGLLQHPWQQPLLTDASSCIPPAWLQGNPYRMRILSSAGVLIRDIDNLPGDPTPPPPPPPVGSLDKPLMTGDLVWNYGTAIITGRVRCNGKSIGSELSGATEFADPTAQNLYVWLWDQDATLPVQGGRGATAAADFAADKPLTLPDFSGRTPFMLDASASGRLNGAPFHTGNATQLGSTLGEGTHLVTVTEMPIFTVTATTATGGAHQHTGTTNANPLISVAEVTDVQGTHAHGGLTASGGAFTPTGSTDTQGQHAHGNATSGDLQSHTHGSWVPASVNTGAGPGPSSTYWWGGGAAQTGTESNPHTHGIATDGQHSHTLILNASPAHTHGISADGSHLHNFNDTTQPHTHPFTTDTGGAHFHTLTSDPVGGNTPHNTVPPAILVTFYLVL